MGADGDEAKGSIEDASVGLLFWVCARKAKAGTTR